MRYVVCMILSLTLLAWSVRIITGYVSDKVNGVAVYTPMALDTAICFAVVAAVLLVLSKHRVRDDKDDEHS